MTDNNATIARCPLPVARCPLPVARCRNSALDFLKGLGCIVVVFIHIRFPGLFGSFVHRSSSFAVPIFFMISGFYAYNSDNTTITRRTRKIFRITLITTLIYILFRLQHMIRHGELHEAFTLWSITRATIRLVILSDFDFAGAFQLWFLCSLIEGYILILLIRRFNLWKAAYAYIPLSIIIAGLITLKFPGKWHLTGNVLVSGMRWILIGHLIAENLHTLSRISRKILIASAIAGYLIGLLSLTGHMLFISSISFNFFPASLFILAVRNDSHTAKFPPSIVKIATDYSLYVYLFHILMNYMYSFILKHAGVSSDTLLVSWTRPVIVLAMSLMLSAIIVKARDTIS